MGEKKKKYLLGVPCPPMANFRQRAKLTWEDMAGPHAQMKGSVPHSELQHDTALQINLLSPLHSASVWVILQCSCSHGQPPSRAAHPNAAFA